MNLNIGFERNLGFVHIFLSKYTWQNVSANKFLYFGKIHLFRFKCTPKYQVECTSIDRDKKMVAGGGTDVLPGQAWWGKNQLVYSSLLPEDG